jgi:hypothetical protein
MRCFSRGETPFAAFFEAADLVKVIWRF